MKNVGKIIDNEVVDVSTGFVSVSNERQGLKPLLDTCLIREVEYVRYHQKFTVAIARLVERLVSIKGGPLFVPGYTRTFKPQGDLYSSIGYCVYGIDVQDGVPIVYYDDRIHNHNSVFEYGQKAYNKICDKLAEIGLDGVNSMKDGELLGHGFALRVNYCDVPYVPDIDRFYEWITTVFMSDHDIQEYLS